MPKDSKGFIRRDIQEEKEHQVQELIKSKLVNCIDLQGIRKELTEEETAAAEQMIIDSTTPGKLQKDSKCCETLRLEIIMSLNVIQDTAEDGNLLCCMATTANDLLLQIHQQYHYPEEHVTGR